MPPEYFQILFVVVEVRRDPQLAAAGGHQDTLFRESARQGRNIVLLKSRGDNGRCAVGYRGAESAQQCRESYRPNRERAAR